MTLLTLWESLALCIYPSSESLVLLGRSLSFSPNLMSIQYKHSVSGTKIKICGSSSSHLSYHLSTLPAVVLRVPFLSGYYWSINFTFIASFSKENSFTMASLLRLTDKNFIQILLQRWSILFSMVFTWYILLLGNQMIKN